MELKETVAVITGGANGIGRATALALARRGAHIVAADIEAENAERVANEIRALGAQALGVGVDVSDGDQVEALAERAYAEFGRVNILFNNAGVGVRQPLHKMPERNWRWVMGVNLDSIYYAARAFIPRMLGHEGPRWIVNTSSEHGISMPFGGQPAYTASKHAVFGLSDVMRRDYAADGIGVSVLCPGWVSTTIWNGMRNRPERWGGPRTVPEEVGAEMRRRGSSPEQVAEAVVRGLEREEFYILSHPEVRDLVEARYRELMEAFDRTAVPPEAV